MYIIQGSWSQMDRAETLRHRIAVFRKAVRLQPYAPDADFYRRQITKDQAELADIERLRERPVTAVTRQ